MKSAGKTLSCAESCTGGQLCAALTALPGASDFFWGGIIVYANDAKRRLAGIDKDLLVAEGPVSAAVTVALADRTRRLSGADYAVAITGLAGPGGQSSGFPIGTVFIAVAAALLPTLHRHLLLHGDRGQIQNAAVKEAISILCKELGV